MKKNNTGAVGESWEEVKNELFTPDEIFEIEAGAALMGSLIEARRRQGISQKRLEELSGVSQPVIARMEKGTTSPQVSTLMKVLRPLGLTLRIVPASGQQTMKESPSGWPSETGKAKVSG